MDSAPFYVPQGDEIAVFEAAYRTRTPVLLKGPTGCGKTRFLEHMAHILGVRDSGEPLPLATVSCSDDLTVGDLVGRYVLDETGTRWIDGPVLATVRSGGICYLDEVIEARRDTVVVIHALTDHRRTLPVARLGQTFVADEAFHLVISYNPGYQSTAKDLKPSTRQRFVAIDLSFPSEEVEARVVQGEEGVDADLAARLAALAGRVRSLQDDLMIEPPSTRLLIHAARLIRSGLPARRACEVAVASAVTDDPQIQAGIQEIVHAMFASDE